jgi:DNA-binding LacI/PurR family transcriptional regulator
MQLTETGEPSEPTGELTIADVAHAAGVSVSTVSRILNNKPDVAEKTRERVLTVIRATGYTPHAQAQGLRAGKTRTIAVIYPLADYPFLQNIRQLELSFMVGAAAATGEANYFFNLVTRPVTEESLLNMYRSAQVDGVVLMEICMQDWRVDLLRKHGLPFVMIGRCADNEGLSYIDLDIEQAVIAAFDHLVALGHRRIGFLSYSAAVYQREFGPAIRSRLAYQRALQKHNLPSLHREVGFTVQDSFDATLDLLGEQPKLTAIVTDLDQMAVGCLWGLHESGLVVPDDFSVVGITTEDQAQMTVPPMTSIEFSASKMGYEAVKMLIAKLQEKQPENHPILISPTLTQRGTSGPPR